MTTRRKRSTPGARLLEWFWIAASIVFVGLLAHVMTEPCDSDPMKIVAAGCE